MALTRTYTNMIGSPGSPATLNPSGSLNGILDLTPAGTFDGSAAAFLTTGTTAPTVATVVAWYESFDATTYPAAPTVVQSVLLSTPSTTYEFGPYVPSSAAVQKIKCVATNGDASQSLGCLVQGATIASSNL